MARCLILLCLFAATSVVYGNAVRHQSKFELDITTPTLYAQFKAGKLVNLYKFVNITAGAHPNILSEVKLFTESAVPRIRFTDEHGNNIELFNSEKKVRAEYHGDTNLIDLPKDYKWYQILVYKTANYTAADIDTILNWKLAEKVTFVAAGKVHLQNEPFWKRLYELKATNPQMEKISYIRS